MKTLVAGWFSFEQMGATAGDLFTRDLVCEWLEHTGHSYDVALASPFEGGVDWRAVNPEDYSHLVFVCGPFGNGPPITEFLPRFAECRLVGVNLTMLEPLEVWNPFELLLERDSSVTSRPDVTFLSCHTHVPVVGLVLIDTQPEYREKDTRHFANSALHQLAASREMAVVPIDTRLDVNSTGLRTPAEVESLIARMDVILTTRLHGVVLALKNGVPVLAIDSVAGGAKVQTQAKTVGWSVVFTVDNLTNDKLQEAFDYCLTDEARQKARECGERAAKMVEKARDEFISAFIGLGRK